ncbi:hypothetical protein EVAR_79758_1 [Eumeta japonica]|uniref:Uncharacterized protein n=1 Tax=Eumeta variegata TaxID=151549 RepID=A0A4C1TCC8_EUMVA|nr:hypothetical protein EVAR_79758_1 [Eumeta japonica]
MTNISARERPTPSREETFRGSLPSSSPDLPTLSPNTPRPVLATLSYWRGRERNRYRFYVMLQRPTRFIERRGNAGNKLNGALRAKVKACHDKRDWLSIMGS